MTTIHMIFNAHIDPVWLWPWQAGLDEVLATCRSACNLLDSDDDLIFNQGEAWAYQQIERLDPAGPLVPMARFCRRGRSAPTRVRRPHAAPAPHRRRLHSGNETANRLEPVSLPLAAPAPSLARRVHCQH
jgi:hypothetical protein